ncbi:MAG: ParB N-terminal domain-containing protein [Synechococcales cyanobacterium T60_A2020_003]|nr:ParB N-terminal domain-containing protein [Synechococcales cyanobacterium T60_A2020_003]
MSLNKLIQTAEKHHAAQSPKTSTSSSIFPLEKIQYRVQNTRELDSEHVNELAESIAVLGLIEPLAIDSKGRLLAGGHRLAAIQQIEANNSTAFQQHFPGGLVPVRHFEFDAEKDADLAFQIEVAENEKRRDYTKDEVREIAERLKSAGFVELKGRPKAGQKALMPALSVVVGKSIRRVRQYLNEAEPSPEKTADESRQLFLLLRKARKSLAAAQEVALQVRGVKSATKSIPSILEQLDEILEKFDGP